VEEAFSQFNTEMTSNDIREVTITGDSVNGVLRNGKRFVTSIPRGEKGLYKALGDHKVKVTIKAKPWNIAFRSILRLGLPVILFVALGMVARHRARSAGQEMLPFLRRYLDSYWSYDLNADRNRETDLIQLVRSIQAPSWAGSITARFLPEGKIRAVVVCIQDLHANVGVQRHQREMIGKLVNVYGFRHVFVEGASGPGDLQLLSSLPPFTRAAFMDGLLRRAYLTGSEYAGASRPDWDFELWGVDDANLYRSNWRPAEAIDVVRDQIVEVSAAFRQRLTRVCAPIVSKELSDFLDSVVRRRADSLSTNISDYVRYLTLYAAAYSITIPSDLRRYVSQVPAEPRGTGRASSDQVTDSLQSAADIESLESEIGDAIARTSGSPVDSPYKFLLDAIDLAARAFSIGMQNEEARSFFAFDARHLEERVKDAVAKINALLGPSDPKLEIPNGFQTVFAKWSLPQAFYRTALARSDAMLTNIASQIERRQIDRAIFVSGGFHSDYVGDQLAHRHGIAALIVTTNVDKLDQEQAYRSRLREDMRADAMEPAPRMSGGLMTAATIFTRAQAILAQILVGRYRTALFVRAQEFAVQSPILDGSERVLELECSETDIVPLLSARLSDGIVMGIDQFDLFMAGTEINLRNPRAYLSRIGEATDFDSAQVLNMNPRFLYFKDESLDWVVSLNMDRIARVADRREVLRESMRCLKPGGVILLLAGRRCDEYARTLLKLGATNVTRMEPVRFSRRTRFITAFKGENHRFGDRFTLHTTRLRFATKNMDGRIVWGEPSSIISHEL
jgi:SAM-dependent methyltransferase